MLNDDRPLAPPLRGLCRICGEQCFGPVTVCVEHAKEVYAKMGGSRDHHVRAYIKQMKAEARAAAKGKTTEAPPRVADIRCACGRVYFRNISALACEARQHQSPPQPKEKTEE